jgi:CheY-like chemotaxis protein
MHRNGRPPHILVANDSADVLALFRELLEEEGYAVSVMAVLSHDLDEIASLSPDLMILDYMWSTDDNNWALLHMLRMDRRTKRTPIILCTGAVRQVEGLSARLGDMNIKIILKPFDIDELLGMVSTALDCDTAAELNIQPYLLDDPEQHAG